MSTISIIKEKLRKIRANIMQIMEDRLIRKLSNKNDRNRFFGSAVKQWLRSFGGEN